MISQLARICLLVAVTACASANPAAAKPRSINDCEKLTDDDAYNKCLASFGPKRGASRSSKAGRTTGITNKRYRRGQSANARRGKSRRPLTAIERRYRRGEAYHARNRLYHIRRSNGRVRTIIPVRRKRR